MSRVELILSEPHLAWVHLDDGEVVVRGDADTLPERDAELVRVFVPPADDVILSPVDLAELPPAQARAAARLAVADESLILSDDLHVVCSEDGLTAASVSRMAVAQWIADFDPDVILPAALLLPRTDEGVCTAHLGALKLVRSPLFAGGWDDVITPLMIGDAPVQALTAAEFDAAMAAAAINPEMNLRQGEFERRTRLTLDGTLLRKIGWLVVALIVTTLVIPLVTMIRLNAQSDTLEATARTAAQTVVGANVPEDQALTVLDARLAALRGGGAGFANTSAAVNLAVQATPNVELTMMTFTPDGLLRAGIRATEPEEIDAVAARMRALGLEVESGPLNPAQGQPIVELKVRGR
jgi:general secretion pathway protein L